MKVLLVDDSMEILEMMREVFCKQGWGVTTATNGKEALEAIVRNTPDVICSDYQMPIMDGVELLKQVRRAYSKMPFFIFTGAPEEALEKARNHDVSWVVEKFQHDKLIKLMAACA